MSGRSALVLGLVVLAAVWLVPLADVLPGPFLAHMTMHMGVVAVAAPLLALGVAGTRFDPVRRAPRWLAPIPASFGELVVVWGWHAPALHQVARETALGFALEQGSFLATGVWLWASALCGDEHRAASRRAVGVVALLLTSMHMTLLGALIALAPRPLYAHACHRASSLTPLEDQQIGGAIMLAVGAASYLAGGVALSARLVREARA
ncbi:cytochrome c oxidase assembly protein [Sandaracinus amylolyticus]|uniref:cytochrome c oxidase assembly protein n=1 Tax=Sandaracinus amylolyticus TaxID=927083 RepID=UPI001969CB3F|nr:cytochrome c oxidase assembly protein [Sandaracinus amylolyticus]